MKFGDLSAREAFLPLIPSCPSCPSWCYKPKSSGLRVAPGLRLKSPGSPRLFFVYLECFVVQILLQIGLRAMPAPGPLWLNHIPLNCELRTGNRGHPATDSWHDAIPRYRMPPISSLKELSVLNSPRLFKFFDDFLQVCRNLPLRGIFAINSHDTRRWIITRPSFDHTINDLKI